MNKIGIGNTRGRGRGRGLPVQNVSDDLLLGLVTAHRAVPEAQFEDAHGDEAEVTHAEQARISKRAHKHGRGKRRGSPKRKGRKEWWKSLTNQRCPLSLKVSHSVGEGFKAQNNHSPSEAPSPFLSLRSPPSS